MKSRKGMVLLLWVAVLASAVGTVSLAQEQFKETKVGDWRAIESAWKHREELSSQERGVWASTEALNGRHATLGIGTCGQYGVHFGFESDAEFEGTQNPDGAEDMIKVGNSRIVYSDILPSKWGLQPTMLDGRDMEYFRADVDAMTRGAKLLICPTRKKDCVA